MRGAEEGEAKPPIGAQVSMDFVSKLRWRRKLFRSREPCKAELRLKRDLEEIQMYRHSYRYSNLK